uniref:Uncharacterized protein n=1 Tax=Opuntia streptacantha TaxID=393608 RepID=A0A7C8ZI87_OPUST
MCLSLSVRVKKQEKKRGGRGRLSLLCLYLLSLFHQCLSMGLMCKLPCIGNCMPYRSRKSDYAPPQCSGKSSEKMTSSVLVGQCGLHVRSSFFWCLIGDLGEEK